MTKVTYVKGGKTIVTQYGLDPAGNRTSMSVTGAEPPQVKIWKTRALESTSMWFGLWLTSPAPRDVTVEWTATDGTAQYGLDYLKNAGTVVIPQGTQTLDFEIPLNNDSLKEGDETFTVQLVSAAGAVIVAGDKDSAVGTIRDDDVAHFNVADVTATSEGDYVALTVERAGSLSEALSVNVATSESTGLDPALSGVDYETTLYSAPGVPLGTNVLTFGANDGASQTIYVKTIADNTYEPDEYFWLDLDWTSDGGFHSSERAQVTIPNDDSLPKVIIGNTSAREGSVMPFTLWMTNPSYQPITVTLKVSDTSTTNTENMNSATSGVDYDVSQAQVAGAGTFTIAGSTLTYEFAPGATNTPLTIPTIQDSLVEGYEAFYVKIDNVVNGVADATHFESRARINDDDGAISASIGSPAPVNEGNSGGGNLIRFPVTLSGLAYDTTTINWAVTGGSATAGSDYTGATSGTLTIPVDASSGYIDFITKPDTTFESDETLTVALNSATNVQLGTPTTATATIKNDDANHAATIGGTITGAVTEDVNVDANGKLKATGTLTISDVDPGEAQMKAGPFNGPYGSISINTSTNVWTYSVANSLAAVQALHTGGTLTDAIQVQSFDGTTKTVTVTINGANDTAVIGGTKTGSVTEDLNVDGNGKLTATGTLTVTDPDSGDAGMVAGSFTGSYGTLLLNASNTWTYSVTNGLAAVQALGTGKTMSDAIQVHSIDGTAATVTITIHGTNDAPTATSDDAGQVDIWDDIDMVHGKLITFDARLPNSSGITDNDGDVDTGDKAALKFHSVAPSAGYPSASISISTDGSQFDVNLRKCGYYQFDYTVEDPSGAVSNVATINVQAISTSTSVSCPIVVPSGTTTPTATLTNNRTVAEGTASANTLQIPVTLSSAAIANTTVTWQVVGGGTAVAGTDFVMPSTNYVNIASGQTTGYIQIQTIPDAITEADKTIQLQLVSGSNADVNTGVVTATITNDDGGPSFSINNASVTEGGVLTFTITKTGATALAHSITYTTANGSAGSGDYTGKTGTYSFAAGDTSKTVSVATTQDSIYEGNETVQMNLSGATNGATISDSQGIGTIVDNDGAPSFSINNASVTEGGVLTFTITKTGATALAHSITYTTANGSAGSGDYTGKTGTYSFAAGDTSKTVSVATTQDSIYEGNETVQMNLSGATNGATISDSQGIGTIVDNDGAPSFSVNNVSVTEGGVLTFTITKTGATAFAHDITYATANGSAGSGDYTGKTGTYSFAAGVTSKTVSVATTQDSIYESNETVKLNLSGATGGATISDSQGIGTITNDDAAPTVNFWLSGGAKKAEGSSFTFVVAKSGSTALNHSVTFSTANGTATAGSDYTSKSVTLTFPSSGADYQEQTVVVNSIDDTTCGEGNETFNGKLSGATNGMTYVNTTKTVTLTENDNCLPVAVNDSYSSNTQQYSGTLNVLANDYDTDGGTLTITSAVKTTTGLGSVTIATDKKSLYFQTVVCGATGISYTISDGQGGSATATATVTVTGCGGGTNLN